MSFRFCAACLLLLSSFGAQAAQHTINVISFRFEPSLLTINPGDTVTWRNMGGTHNVKADDGSFTNGGPSSSAWTFTRTFNTPGDIGYYCEPHGAPDGEGMAGKIRVTGTATFAINYGISGTWFNPATSGQGFFIEVVPNLNNSMVISWFTWTGTTGVHDWFTGIGPFSGNTATLDLQHTTGGRFNDPAPVTTSSVGSATARFTDCNNGTITFTRNDTGQTGTIPIVRLTTTPTACTNP